MKTIYSATILLFMYGSIHSQALTKNAKGESSVLFRGYSIGLNVADTELNFGMNNLSSMTGKNGLIFGGNVAAKNETGLGSIFSGGDFVPTGKGEAFVGYSWSNGSNLNCETKRREVLSEYTRYLQSIIPIYKAEIKPVIVGITTPADPATSKLDELQKFLLEKIEKIEFLTEVPPLLAVGTDDTDEEKTAKTAIENRHKELYKKMTEEIAALEAKLKAAREANCDEHYCQVITFGFGGMNGSSFKRFTGFDETDYSKSTADENFRGGKGGIGINVQCGSFVFGTTLSRQRTNNFSTLTKKEYTYRVTQPVVAEATIIEEKKVTAYSGEYSEIYINNLQIDLIYNIKLDEEAKNHVLVNPYWSRAFHSDNVALLPNSTDVGCGFYFFQQTGKFMGGFFLEIPDIQNSYERAKPLEDQNLRDPLKKISLGIVSQFSISGLLNAL